MITPQSGAAAARIIGERTIAAVHRMRSLESRMSSLLAVAMMCALGAGLLIWYYRSAAARAAGTQSHAPVSARAQGEMPLPSLGPIAAAMPVAATAEHAQAREVPGPADPPLSLAAAEPQPYLLPATSSQSAGASLPAAANSALQRRLSGPAFTRGAESSSTDAPPPASAGVGGPSVSTAGPRGATDAPSQAVTSASVTTPGELSPLLRPSVTPAVPAAMLPTQRLLLPKGAFIDCTLETAIDSTLPGMTTCVTATDTFGADGTVVLLERGSKLVGETRGEVAQGSARVFVLWSEARTPAGIVVPLASPGTDELGRAGLSGTVDRHFWQRFGAALLISIVNGAAQAAVASAGSGAVIYNPTASQDVTTEVLKGALGIAPTVRKAQGDRIQILVARDIDFRPVYELRTRSH